MREPERIDKMVELLRALWKKYPDWRLGQLVLNAHSAVAASGEVYFAEDDVLELGLRKLLGSPPDDRDRVAKAA
jgi:uncharacterized protein YihD (DUF1040 family)